MVRSEVGPYRSFPVSLSSFFRTFCSARFFECPDWASCSGEILKVAFLGPPHVDAFRLVAVTKYLSEASLLLLLAIVEILMLTVQ